MSSIPSQKSVRNRLYGRDLAIADGLFPTELAVALMAGVFPLTEGDYWHLRRLKRKVRLYRRNLPLALGGLVVLEIASLILLHIGIIQTLVIAAAFYWVFGLFLKAKAVEKLLVPYEEVLSKPPAEG